MNVLMVLDEEFPPDIRVENEAEALIKDGHSVTLACYTRKKLTEKETYKGIDIVRFPITDLLYKLKALSLSVPYYFNFWYKNLNLILQKNRFDVIHIHDLPLIKPGLKLSRKFNIQLVADYHENRPEIMKMYKHVKTFPGNILISLKAWQKYQKEITPEVDKLILVTNEAKDFYVDEYGLKRDKIFVVPNYADVKKSINVKIDKSIINKYKNKFALVYFGDTGFRRGTLNIIEAAKALKKNNKIQFIIIGTSKEQYLLENEVKNHNLNNVLLTGYLPYEKAASYIAASKAGLCPFLRNIHHDTTYAKKMFQYMAFRKPVIVSDCTAQTNVVKKYRCGAVYKAGNSHELVDRIIQIMNNQIYQQLSDNAYQAVQQDLKAENANKELIKLYNSFEIKA